MDIEAPWITQMSRTGNCKEYEDFYGISKEESDDDFYGPDTSDEVLFSRTPI